jgi:hypothetical protein
VGGRVGDRPEFKGPRGSVIWSIVTLE